MTVDQKAPWLPKSPSGNTLYTPELLQLPFSCFAAARTACVSTWLGELCTETPACWNIRIHIPVIALFQSPSRARSLWPGINSCSSPNQVLKHAARAAASRLLSHLCSGRSRRAQGSGQSNSYSDIWYVNFTCSEIGDIPGLTGSAPENA